MEIIVNVVETVKKFEVVEAVVQIIIDTLQTMQIFLVVSLWCIVTPTEDIIMCLLIATAKHRVTGTTTR